MAQYGSTDSGASLGDILGAALTRAQEGTDDTEAAADDAAEPQDAPEAEAAETEAAPEEGAAEEEEAQEK